MYQFSGLAPPAPHRSIPSLSETSVDSVLKGLERAVVELLSSPYIALIDLHVSRPDYLPTVNTTDHKLG